MGTIRDDGKLNQWLRGLRAEAREDRPLRVVLGNEAADLDSMASSVVYAWFLGGEPPAAQGDQGNRLTLPVINIPREDFALRTEAVWLFREAGVAVESLVFLDEVDLDRIQAQGRLRLVLVDHNRLPAVRGAWASAVEEILDHHEDEGQHTQAKRTIAAVGSSATLVAERWLQSAAGRPDPAAATLLLGTILLDTVNLDPAAKRVTPRDELAAARLQESTRADRAVLFERLQAEKFNVSALSTRDILRKDYKEYQMGALKCGISSALLPLGDWLRKDPRLEDSFAAYCESRGLDLLLAMSAYTQPEFRRELAVYSAEDPLRERVVSFLDGAGLGLSPLPVQTGAQGARLRCYAQADASASRKKLQPLLAGYLQGEGGGATSGG